MAQNNQMQIHHKERVARTWRVRFTTYNLSQMHRQKFNNSSQKQYWFQPYALGNWEWSCTCICRCIRLRAGLPSGGWCSTEPQSCGSRRSPCHHWTAASWSGRSPRWLQRREHTVTAAEAAYSYGTRMAAVKGAYSYSSGGSIQLQYQNGYSGGSIQ